MESSDVGSYPCLAQRARPAGPHRNPTFSLECCRIRPRTRRNLSIQSYNGVGRNGDGEMGYGVYWGRAVVN